MSDSQITNYKLRWYQAEAVAAAAEYLRRPIKKNGFVLLPTGSGKSLVIANIIKNVPGKTLVFQPSREILEQNFEKLRSYGYEPGIWSASLGIKERKEITLATIGSVAKDPNAFDGTRNVLIDECHLVNPKAGMYSEFLKALGGIRVLGLTATPYRLSSDNYGGSKLKFLTRTRPTIFQDVVYYVQNSQLFEQGHLAKLEYFQIKGFDKSQVKANSTGAEYDEQSLQKHLWETGFKDKILKAIKRLIEVGRKSILVFASSVIEAIYIKTQIPGAAIVTGSTPGPERAEILRKFKAGLIKVVCNYGVLTTGFDYPELDTVLIARPTMSLALWYQMVGRGMRPHPSKASTWIIDMGGLVEQFGRVEDMRLEKDEGKWILSSKGKPLTNVYFGDFKPRFIPKGRRKTA